MLFDTLKNITTFFPSILAISETANTFYIKATCGASASALAGLDSASLASLATSATGNCFKR